MQRTVDRCSQWSGPGRKGLASWVFEEAANATAEVAEAAAKRAQHEALAPAQAYVCKAPLVLMLKQRMERFLEQPTHINLLVTDLYKSLLEVKLARACFSGCAGEKVGTPLSQRHGSVAPVPLQIPHDPLQTFLLGDTDGSLWTLLHVVRITRAWSADVARFSLSARPHRILFSAQLKEKVALCAGRDAELEREVADTRQALE